MSECRFYIFLIAILSNTPLFAEGYFCSQKGIVMEFVRVNSKDRSREWIHKISISDVKGDRNTSCTVTGISEITHPDGRPYFKKNISETVLVTPQKVVLDIGKYVASYAEARTGLGFKSETIWTELPSDLEPGDLLPDISVKVKWALISVDVAVTERRVLRNETLITPAGTFDCIVIEEHREEHGPGHNRSLTNTTWYSKGIGYVRHDTFDNVKGVKVTEETLNSIRR